MKSVLSICILVLFADPAGWPQASQPPAKVLKGSVAGHVYCADTNAPARFAWVTIEPASDFDVPDAKAPANEAPMQQLQQPSINAVQTRLDGSYLLSDIAPGQYYVLAEMQGYISPLAQITKDEVATASTDDLKHMRSVLQAVTVVGGETAHIDFSLRRGAALSGRIFYDDGSPVIGSIVTLLRKEKDGSWKSLSNGMHGRFSNRETTDDLGRYRIAALPPGEYIPAVELYQGSFSMSGAFLGSGGYSTYSRIPQKMISIYLGDTARKSAAKSVYLAEGTEMPGVDIMLPISKFHTITGSLVSQDDEHSLNAGSITLLDAFDRSIIRTTRVDYESHSFLINMVPEGDYVLRVTDASDAVSETMSAGTGITTRFRPVHQYLNAEQSLSVNGDISGVVIKLLPQPEDSGKK
jgi:hypothetical protein